ncbi:hypothetical protein EB118_26345 [bacterium]|nr:hypothetical protein [bacterium]
MTNKPSNEEQIARLNSLRTIDLLIELKHLNDDKSEDALILKKLILDILVHRLPEDEYDEISKCI